MAYKTKNIGFANILLYLMNNTAMISKIYCLSYKDSEWDIVIESVNVDDNLFPFLVCVA